MILEQAASVLVADHYGRSPGHPPHQNDERGEWSPASIYRLFAVRRQHSQSYETGAPPIHTVTAAALM